MNFASLLLTLSLVPLTIGIVIDTYLLAWLIIGGEMPSLCIAAGLLMFLVALWFVLPQRARRARERARSELRGAA